MATEQTVPDGNFVHKHRTNFGYIPASNIEGARLREHPFGFDDQNRRTTANPQPAAEDADFVTATAFSKLEAQMRQIGVRNGAINDMKDTILGMAMPGHMRGGDYEGARQMLDARMGPANAIAKAFRADSRSFQPGPQGKELPTPTPDMERAIMAKSAALAKSGAMAKAVLDVGTSTNFSAITGGQSLGYVSLDTRIARGTVRPDSFTLYQALPKSAAFQVVDYWAYIDDPGGPIPGAAFTGFSSVNSGTLATNAGIYSLQNILLKLAVDGRAVTTALMSQNSFVDVTAQENANAALSVLNSVNWASYWGNTTLYTNHPAGLASTIPTVNWFDFQDFYAANAAINGWSIEQALYNLIYEAAAVITSWGRFGRITHAFMTPVTNGALQGLVTTVLNNLVTVVSREQRELPGIVVDGDLQGMRTRMGTIQFPLDLFITARDIPAQGQVRSNNTTPALLTGPTPPTGVVATLVSGASAAGTNWGDGWAGVAGAFVLPATGTGLSAPQYCYAVASTDAESDESIVTYSNIISGITSTGAILLTIAPPAAVDATVFRVYRSGNGWSGVVAGVATSATSGYASKFRYIGSVAANGASNVTFTDKNENLPGSETIFLLDLREEDFALDYRYLLPLTRVELFAQNLYMPWAVASIGAIRNRIPKFHGVIKNFIPDNPSWNPLQPNT